MERLEDRRLLTTFDLSQTFTNPTLADGDLFGSAVAISGDRVLVGVPREETGASNAGSAYLFDALTGELLETFHNPTPAANDFFGFSVAISGDHVVVGAQGDDTGASSAGSAYLFDAATGNLLYTFNNPTPESFDNFGVSVAVSGDNILVGASGDNTGASAAGSAYLYDAVTGSLLHTFHNPSPESLAQFGFSLAISGDNVLVGAFRDDTGAADAGSAYLFDAVSGDLVHTFNNPTPATNDVFGISVAISGDNILVGAEGDDTGATDAGSAYLFDAVTGSLLHTFNNPTPTIEELFGTINSVSISGDNVLIGALQDDTGASDAGSAYLFDAVTGNLVHTFNNPTPETFDNFGGAVAISGDNIVVAAPFDNTGANNAGSAYLFDAVSGNLQHTVNNPALGFDDQFGTSVSISGDHVLVGAADDDTGATDAGSAYLFDAVTGTLLHTFNNPMPDEDDVFGRSVAISGDTILVGAPLDDTVGVQAGAAYLFDAVTGNLLHTLHIPAVTFGDGFGGAVAISGNYVLVGAEGNDTGTTNAGSAYLFDAVTGDLLHTFNNPTPGVSDQFGRSVAISGNNIVIGAFRDDTSGTAAGSAYLFDAVGGNLIHTFNNPTPEFQDQFGMSVAISGDNVLVGAYRDNTGAGLAGSAYLFDAVSGSLVHTLNNPAPEFADFFGWSVAISGDNVLVGAFRDNTGAESTGSAYLFDAVTGNLMHTFNNPTPDLQDFFGWSVAISNDNVLIGAPLDDTVAENAGSAYLFVKSGNSDPVITAFTSDATVTEKGIEGEPVNVSGSFTDAGTGDTHTATVDWGDGSAAEMITVIEAAGAGTVSGSHPYEFGGTYTITLTLDDGNGGAAMATTTAVVSGFGLNGGVLQLVGTAGNDTVSISSSGDQLTVRSNFLPGSIRSFPLADISKIEISLAEGDDMVNISNRITIPAVIDGGPGDDFLDAGGGDDIVRGGDGNDTISGGSGNDILVGGDGRDLILGSTGLDILIGGLDRDRLFGNRDQDILIGGTTDHDGDDEALMAILAEWTSAKPFAVRQDNLIDGSGGGGLNDGFFLDPGETVDDDSAFDLVFGGLGIDWTIDS